MRRDLAEQIVRNRGKHSVSDAVDKWLQKRSDRVERFKNMLVEMRLREEVDFATLTVAARELRDLISD